MTTCARFAVVGAVLFMKASLGQGIPPARWDTSNAQAFPRGVGPAVEKYLPEYRKDDAKKAAAFLLEIYRTRDQRFVTALSELSSDSLLPLGDVLLGAFAEHGAAKAGLMKTKVRLYPDSTDAIEFRAALSRAVYMIGVAAVAIGQRRDPRMVTVLKRFDSVDDVELRADLDEAIAKSKSGETSK